MRFLLAALPFLFAGCGARQESPPPSDPVSRVLEAAARAVGVGNELEGAADRVDADVEGPDGAFRTLIRSSSDGRMRMEQHMHAKQVIHCERNNQK